MACYKVVTLEMDHREPLHESQVYLSQSVSFWQHLKWITTNHCRGKAVQSSGAAIHDHLSIL